MTALLRRAMRSRHLPKVQATSGLVFALFLTLHLATTASATVGASTYDAVLLKLRAVYRPHLIFELLLIGIPAVVHIACAVLRLLSRRGKGQRPSLRVRIHRWSGYVLLAAIGGHVFATRIMPALAEAATTTATGAADLAYLAYSVRNWPVFIDPYYILFGIAGALHLGLGVPLALKLLLPQRVKTQTAQRLGLALAALLLIAVTAGVSSIIAHADEADTTRFPEYEALYQQYMPFLPPTIDAISGEPLDAVESGPGGE